MNARFAIALVALMLACSPGRAADAQAAAVIAKARAALGSEQDLDAVKSIHFKGTLETTEKVQDPADATKAVTRPVRLAVDIIFQKPMQQRFSLRSDKLERVTGLDDLDGWEKLVDTVAKTTPRLVLLDAATIKRLRANTWENLGFYHGFEHHGGVAQYEGDVTVDGVACAKLTFRYSDTIVFTRYFDKATGRLIKSDMDNGMELREDGEIRVKGIRFPKKLVQRAANGTEATITFDEIVVNEPTAPSEFAMPPITIR